MWFKKSALMLNDDDATPFPMLFSEPWRIEELIAEESTKQRLHMFNLMIILRMVLVVIAAIIFYFLDEIDATLLVCIAFYFLLVGSLALHTKIKKLPERIYLYGFYIGVLDLLLLCYLALISNNRVELSFIFLSTVLSGLLLPLGRLLLLVALAWVAIVISWLQISDDWLISLFKIDASQRETMLNLLLSSIRYELKTPGLLMLLISLLCLAVVVNWLANWSFNNDVNAQFRYRQIRQLLSFNRAVIEHLKNGVIVIGHNGKIISINAQAVALLNLSTSKPITDMKSLSGELLRRYQAWLSAGIDNKLVYQHNVNAQEVFVTFSGFGPLKDRHIVMMTLESVNETFQQTQEAKLASLGRLTAGVAHEIRNPLSSINSAAQLLAEMSQEGTNQHLSQMILKNVKRTDQIINDILGLFRDTKADRQMLSISAELKKFAKEFLEVYSDKQLKIRLVSQEKQPLYFQFDPGQFSQILWNLAQNSLKHSGSEALQMTLRYGLSSTRKYLFIDVMDNGQGVPENKVMQIFEPFYTNGSGTGLGLYLVRELCHANNANVSYINLKKQEKKPENKPAQPVQTMTDNDLYQQMSIRGQVTVRQKHFARQFDRFKKLEAKVEEEKPLAVAPVTATEMDVENNTQVVGACFRISVQVYFNQNIQSKK